MYKPEDIQEQFGDDTLAYLQRKQRGGDSGQQGIRYEYYFAVYRLAQLAPTIMEVGLTVDFHSQILTFVDDLIIDIEAKPIQPYQLKSSPGVSWSTGKHPLQDDFAHQEELNRVCLARESHLALVVSDLDCAERLTATIPPSVQAFSQVWHFPYAPDSFTIIGQVPDFKDALEYLSAFDNPPPAKIAYVAAALIGAWIDCQSSSLDFGQKGDAQVMHYGEERGII